MIKIPQLSAVELVTDLRLTGCIDADRILHAHPLGARYFVDENE